MKLILICLFFIIGCSNAQTNCNGACQDVGVECDVDYVAGLCPGPDNIQCCEEATPDCPGKCMDDSLDCDGSYVQNLCPGPDNVQCCETSAPPSPAPAGSCADFANSEWNCADPSCSSRVCTGCGQPNYECAEFVARSLAAGGMIPLDAYASQKDYGSFSANGRTYDLLWVSSKQGGPLGLDDYLSDSGWSSCGNDASCVSECSALIVDGSEGAYSHAVVGVGEGIVDAHNVARQGVAANFYSINVIYNPPDNVVEIVAKQRQENLKNKTKLSTFRNRRK